MTWDLNARHLVLTWPCQHSKLRIFSPFGSRAMAKCSVFSDAELKKQTGMVFAGADLVTPEGNFFYVSRRCCPAAHLNRCRRKYTDLYGT
jgi:hypothetical protein